MKVDIVDVLKYSAAELLTRLYEVKLMNTDINIYKDSTIMLEFESPIQELYPCQYYLSKAELIKVRNLNYALKKYGINMFKLDGFVKITLKDEDGETFDIDLLPPVIEKTLMPNGSYYNLINDGMHRIYLAMLEHELIKCVHIGTSDLLKEYPYYAYPIPNFNNPDKPAWRDIKVYDTLPEGMIKRWHRNEVPKSLYRNFNSVFSGVSGRHIKK